MRETPLQNKILKERLILEQIIKIVDNYGLSQSGKEQLIVTWFGGFANRHMNFYHYQNQKED